MEELGKSNGSTRKDSREDIQRGEAHRSAATARRPRYPVAARRRLGDGEAFVAAAVLGVERHDVRAKCSAQAKRRGGKEED